MRFVWQKFRLTYDHYMLSIYGERNFNWAWGMRPNMQTKANEEIFPLVLENFFGFSYQ